MHAYMSSGDHNKRSGSIPAWVYAMDAEREARAILAENETIYAYDQQQHAHPRSLRSWPEGAALAEALSAFVNEEN